MNVEVSGAAIPRFSRREIGAFTSKVLLALRKGGAISDVSIAFVDDASMQQLNKRYRRRNRTTDVLTFPADESYADPRATKRPLTAVPTALAAYPSSPTRVAALV